MTRTDQALRLLDAVDGAAHDAWGNIDPAYMDRYSEATAALRALLTSGEDEIDVSVSPELTVWIDLETGKRSMSVGVTQDGGVVFAALIDGDRYHGRLDKPALSESIRSACEMEMRDHAEWQRFQSARLAGKEKAE